jgi:septum formation protein
MLSLLKNIDCFEVILASASPRRRELLNMIGMNFKVQPSHVREVFQDHLSPLEYAMENARRKGFAVAGEVDKSLVISADTIVVLDKEILEKPRDEQHAVQILKKLSGKTHQVITAFGIIVKSLDYSVFDHESTAVTFRKLTDAEIGIYVQSGEPLDKAGAYGAQGFGALFIERVDGCFFNVVGLPLAKFFNVLSTFLSGMDNK